MAYTVKEHVVNNYERKDFEEGIHDVSISYAEERKTTWVDEKAKELLGLKEVNQISIAFKGDANESIWYNINQKFNPEDLTLEYDNNRMNEISIAIGIPLGTSFANITEWLEYIKGKRVNINVTTYNDKLRVSGIKQTELPY